MASDHPINQQLRLAARPVGEITDACWEFTEEPVPALEDGQFLVRVSHVSLDPAMRGWMNEGRSYIPPVKLGDVMRAGTVGTVVESKADGYAAGDVVYGAFGVQDYCVTTAAEKVDTSVVPLPTYLAALGMPGMTAYFGLLDVGKPEAGQTVVVSGAAGAVGSVVGQIAKIKGCRVVGIAGGPEKCAWLKDELGFDAVIDYKNEDVRRGLREHCPDGIDVYFDNVGGDILDAALTRLAMHARIVICGAISQYNAEGGMVGPSNYMSLLVFRASMTGMVVFDYANRYGEAAAEMAGWIAEGKLVSREDIVEGSVRDFPATLAKLFSGANTGKLVLELTGARG